MSHFSRDAVILRRTCREQCCHVWGSGVMMKKDVTMVITTKCSLEKFCIWIKLFATVYLFFFLLDAICPQVNMCSVWKTPAYIILHLFQPWWSFLLLLWPAVYLLLVVGTLLLFFQNKGYLSTVVMMEIRFWQIPLFLISVSLALST